MTPGTAFDRGPRTASTGKGASLMIGATGCFTVNDALCKWLMPQFSVGQIVTLRSLAVLALVANAALLSRAISRQIVFKSYKLHAIRATLLAISTMLFLTGLSRMPLTNAVALSFTSPLFVAALAQPMLGERVVGRCWIAIGVGFVGAALILDPSVREFGWFSVFPACAAIVTAATDMMTRRMSNHETSASFVVSSAIGTLMFGFAASLSEWRSGDAASIAIVVVAGAFIFGSYYLNAEAFRHAPAFLVSPFRYSALIWSLIIAFVAWGQMPNPLVLAGAAMLAVSGWYLSRASWTRS